MRIVILRDPRENPKKCSLTPLRGKAGVDFLSFDPRQVYELGPATLLDHSGPILTACDAKRPLVLLDCSWRRLPVLRRSLRGEIFARSVPQNFLTAYPRKSKTFEDPANGLASIEALYAASATMGEPRAELLEGYRWREEFFEKNRQLLDLLATGRS